jgi:hypothetical protein
VARVGRAGAAVRPDRPVARLDVCARSRASREARRASDRQRCLQGTKAAHQSAERCASDQPSAPWMASAVPLLACSLRWSSRTSVVDAIRHKPIRESSSAGSNRRTRCILASNDVVGMLSVSCLWAMLIFSKSINIPCAQVRHITNPRRQPRKIPEIH